MHTNTCHNGYYPYQLKDMSINEFEIKVTIEPPPEPEFNDDNPPTWYDTTGTPYWDEDEMMPDHDEES